MFKKGESGGHFKKGSLDGFYKQLGNFYVKGSHTPFINANDLDKNGVRSAPNHLEKHHK